LRRDFVEEATLETSNDVSNIRNILEEPSASSIYESVS
jgi:hypothetical protein